MADVAKQKEKLVSDLDVQLSKVENALASMKKSIDVLQSGNGKFPYWNGSNAYSIVKTALTQYQNDLNLIRNINECKAKIKK